MRKIYIFIALALLWLKKWQAQSPKLNSDDYKTHKFLKSKIRLEWLKRSLAAYAIITLLSIYSLSAQERLIIGDKVPDVAFATILNYKDSSLHFSQLRGKAVILDCWATYCTACLKEFPKMDSLQRVYAKNLQIILMNAYTKDTKSVLQAFLKERLSTPEGFSIPLVQLTEAIHQVFPIKSMPHYIWVGADGRIKAITRADQVTPANIERLIAGLTLNLKLKKD